MGVFLGDTLPALLKARGMTQEQLAKLAKMKRTDINRIANNKLSVGPERLRRIAEGLEVSVIELAPAEEPDSLGLTFRDRLEALEARQAELLARTTAVRRHLNEAVRRIRALEEQVQQGQTKAHPRQRGTQS